MMRRSVLLLPLSAALLIFSSAAGAQQIDTLALKAHTRFLSSDQLAGRGTGSPGARTAALYIARQLVELGIPGAGPDGSYLQRIPLRRVEIDRAETHVTIERGAFSSDSSEPTEDAGRAAKTAGSAPAEGSAPPRRFSAGEDFLVHIGGKGAFRDFAGDAIFAGTAGVAAEGLEDVGSLENRVIVLLGTLGREASLELVPEWIRRGAEGVIMLVPGAEGFERLQNTHERFRFTVNDPTIDAPIWQPELPMLTAGPRLTAALLEGASISRAALTGKVPFHAIPLERRVSAELQVEFHPVRAQNVAALLPGSDPELSDEVVAYTAHYDHLGVGAPDSSGDSIYNGFSDNAAGVAMLLAIAQELRKNPPARSVLFLFLGAEEQGLLGSTYYAAEPLVPLERTVAVINLDAGAPPAPPAEWRVAGGQASTLGSLAVRVAERHGWEGETSAASANSDYWPFLRAGVPAVFLIPGQAWEGVSEEEARKLHLRWDHYHQPADEWSPEFPWSGVERYASYALALGRAVASAEEAPRLLPE